MTTATFYISKRRRYSLLLGIVSFFLPFVSLAQQNSLPQQVDKVLLNAASAQRVEEIYTNQMKNLKSMSDINTKWDNPNINVDVGRLLNTGNIGPSYSVGFEQNADVFGVKKTNQKYTQSVLAMLKLEKDISKSQLLNFHLLKWVTLKLENDRLSFLARNKGELEVMEKYLKNKKFRSNQGKATVFLIHNKVTSLQIEYQNRRAYIENELRYFKQFNPESNLQSLLAKARWKSLSHLNVVFTETANNTDIFMKQDSLHHQELDTQEEVITAKGKGSFSVRYDYFAEKVPGGNSGHVMGITYNIPLFTNTDDYSQAAKFQRKYQYLMHKKKRFLKQQRVIQLTNEFNSLYRQYKKLDSEAKLKKEFKVLKDLFFKGAIAVSSFLDSFDMLNARINQRYQLRGQLLSHLVEVANLRGIKMTSEGVLK